MDAIAERVLLQDIADGLAKDTLAEPDLTCRDSLDAGNEGERKKVCASPSAYTAMLCMASGGFRGALSSGEGPCAARQGAVPAESIL